MSWNLALKSLWEPFLNTVFEYVFTLIAFNLNSMSLRRIGEVLAILNASSMLREFEALNED